MEKGIANSPRSLNTGIENAAPRNKKISAFLPSSLRLILSYRYHFLSMSRLGVIRNDLCSFSIDLMPHSRDVLVRIPAIGRWCRDMQNVHDYVHHAYCQKELPQRLPYVFHSPSF